VDHIIDVSRNLASNHCSNEAHQPVGFTEFAAADGLNYDYEGIVNLIIQFLMS
jgi:hypothetical protein